MLFADLLLVAVPTAQGPRVQKVRTHKKHFCTHFDHHVHKCFGFFFTVEMCGPLHQVSNRCGFISAHFGLLATLTGYVRKGFLELF